MDSSLYPLFFVIAYYLSGLLTFFFFVKYEDEEWVCLERETIIRDFLCSLILWPIYFIFKAYSFFNPYFQKQKNVFLDKAIIFLSSIRQKEKDKIKIKIKKEINSISKESKNEGIS